MDHITIDVRPGTTTDAEALSRLAEVAFPLACPSGSDPAAIAAHIARELDVAHFRHWATSPDHVLLVAVDRAAPGVDQGPVGFAMVTRGVPDNAEAASRVSTDVELSKIYVHPDAHGTPVAGELMVAALDGARTQLGAGAVWLGTNSENLRAQAFYRKHGFETVATRTYVVGGEVHDDIVMERAPQD